VAPTNGKYFNPKVETVSCRSATACIAAGMSDRGRSGQGTYAVVEAWNGQKWHLLAGPKVPGAHSEMLATGCAATRCWAGGYDMRIAPQPDQPAVSVPLLAAVG
jgi:hypothetical protein